MCEIYFKVNNKITRTTSLTLFWCFYYLLYAYFTYFSSVPIIDFEQLNVSWVVGIPKTSETPKHQMIGILKVS